MSASKYSTRLFSKFSPFVNFLNSLDYWKVFIVCFSAITFVHFTIAAFKTKPVDFYAYYTGAGLLVNDKEHLYNPYKQFETQEAYFKEGYTFETGFMSFINLPISAVVYIPFLKIPPRLAADLIQPLSLIAILFGIFRLYRFHKIKFASWTTFAVACFYPLYASVHLAQIAVLIFLVLVEMYIAFIERKSLRLGLLASLLLLKYQYVVLIPLIYALYPDRKNYLKAVLPGTLLLMVGNFLVMDRDLIHQYIELIRLYQSSPLQFGMEFKYGMDILSCISHFLGGSADYVIFQRMVLGLAFTHSLVFILLLTNSKLFKASHEIFYFIIIYSLIFGPHTLPSDFLYLLVPIVGLLPRIKKRWFYLVSFFVLDLFFFYSVYGTQRIHTLLLLLYAPTLLMAAFNESTTKTQEAVNYTG